MRRLDKLPPAFKRYAKVGGAFVFAVFDDAEDGEEAAITAIRGLLGSEIDETVLRAIGHRRIELAEFLGRHGDPESRKLIKRGSWRTLDGRELVDPLLVDMGRTQLAGGGYAIPEAGEGGQFAHGFAFPPYGLDTSPREIQALFDEVLGFLLPSGTPHVIHDWTSPRLAEVSPWFEPGMEWWGAFLFTIHQPERRRLIALAASTTD